MQAQDWALKHEAVAQLFAEDGDKIKPIHHLGEEDTIIINAHSDQYGRIIGRSFAWTTVSAPSIQAAEEVEDAPDYELSNTSSDATIILPSKQGPRPRPGVLASEHGIVRDAQATGTTATAGPMAPYVFGTANSNISSSEDDPFVDGNSLGPSNARTIRQAASAATAALRTSDDDPFVHNLSQGSLRVGNHAQQILSSTQPRMPGLSISGQMPASSFAPSRSRPTANNPFPSRPILKRQYSTIEDHQGYDADNGDVDSEQVKQPPKKKKSKVHFADLPRSRYRGGEVPSDDEADHRDTLYERSRNGHDRR